MPRILKSDEPYAKFLLFKGHWERKYPGEKYFKMDKDLRFAKQLCEIDDAEIVKRIRVYLKNQWYGEHTKHSLAAFVTNFNMWVEETHGNQEVLIDCPVCGERHRPHKDCSKEGKVVTMPKEVGDALTLLATKMAVNK